MKNVALILALILATISMSTFGQAIRDIETGVLSLKQQASAPSSPASGKYKAYVRDGKMRVKDSAGVEKTVGSGGASVGGINLLDNESFEDGVSTGWTSSGGTFSSQSYTNTKDDNLKYARLVSTVIGDYFESTARTIPDSLGKGCMADLSVQVTSGSWTYSVYDGSSNVLATGTIVAANATDWFAQNTLSFTCPAAGSTVKIRVTSTATGTINADLGYLGGNKNVSQVAQGKLAGESYFATAASATCTRASATYGALTCNAAMTGPTVLFSSMGSWQTTDVNLPEQTVNNLPAGKYKATFYITSYLDSASYTGLTINDGSTTCTAGGQAAGTGNQSQGSVSCYFEYTAAGNRSFELYVATNAGTNFNLKNDITSPSIPTHFILEYIPSDIQGAVTPEAQAWVIDANIGGGNATLSTGNVSSYTEITNASLDMVLNTGSATARIPCSSTNAASGLTCSAGSESIGVNFTNPFAGFFEVCADFSDSVEGASGTYAIRTFQLVETTNATQTIVQEGKSRLTTGAANNTSAANVVNAVRSCGVFYFTSIAERTIRLMYEQSVSGTPTSSVLADRSASIGQRDIHFIVRPLLSAFNRPYLTGDQVTSKNMTKPKFCSFWVSSGNAVSAVNGCLNTPSTSYSGGTLDITFSGEWGAAPNCFCNTIDNQGGCSESSTSSPSTTGYGFITRTAAAATSNTGATIFCHGQGI